MSTSDENTPDIPDAAEAVPGAVSGAAGAAAEKAEAVVGKAGEAAGAAAERAEGAADAAAAKARAAAGKAEDVAGRVTEKLPGAGTPPTSGPVPAGATPVRPPLPAPAPADRVSASEEAARHAAARPAPVPPGPPLAAGAPLRVPSRETPPASSPGAPTAPLPPAATAPVPPLSGTGGSAATKEAAAAGAAAGIAAAAALNPPKPAPVDERLFPDPNAPRTISVGTHVLGVLVGIVLPVAAAAVTLLGNSRILAVEADGWVARVENLGIVLVTLGVLLLFASALLSLWTPSVGLVGGAILTLLGGFALFAPGLARNAVLDVLTSQEWEPTVTQTLVAITSGTLLVVGMLLLASGVVSAVARRHGIRLGAFRERHRA